MTKKQLNELVQLHGARVAKAFEDLKSANNEDEGYYRALVEVAIERKQSMKRSYDAR